MMAVFVVPAGAADLRNANPAQNGESIIVPFADVIVYKT